MGRWGFSAALFAAAAVVLWILFLIPGAEERRLRHD
jgi:hypothetical protein